MSVQLWQWIALTIAVAAMLLVDLRAGGRPPDRGRLRAAVAWSVLWAAVGAGFAGVIWLSAGPSPAGQYLSGYLIERTLSIDNVFVLALVFQVLAVPPASRRFAVAWGIVLALVLRAAMIAAGVAVLGAAPWVEWVFAAFLIATGARIATRSGDHEARPSRILMLARSRLPIGRAYAGGRLAVRRSGRLQLTPLVVVMAAVAVTDLIFALDSIPSILAVTREPFLVVAANAMALIGLRALYDVLEGMMDRFPYLNAGLGLVLVAVGAKMAAAGVYEPPIGLTLGVIAAVVGASVALSLLRAPASVPVPPKERINHAPETRYPARHRRPRRSAGRALDLRRRR
ncbi:MAG TPA: TerC/Alx family metal homeostasis membrane protein [Gaiellales bacterium]|nr:TerC/Alx family metal homeostasis membrane protein [Gaiellales bacterium]